MEEMNQLLQLLREVDDEIDFEGEEALVDDGILDSLTILNIINALNDAYGIAIRTADIEPENFNTTDGILALVQRYRGKA